MAPVDRLGPGVEVLEEAGKVVTDRVQQRPFELVAADLNLLPEPHQLAPRLIALVATQPSNPTPAHSMAAPRLPRATGPLPSVWPPHGSQACRPAP